MKFVKTVLLNVLITFVLLEAGLFIAAELNLLRMDLPSYRLANAKPFWEDRNRDFGVWHAPDREYRHLKSCFNVTYRTNVHGTKPRPVLIMSIPRHSDYIRAGSEPGTPPLTGQLRELSQSIGATYVDLLEKSGGASDFSRYFYSCDPQWSPAGHQMAADQLDGWSYYGAGAKNTTSALTR